MLSFAENCVLLVYFNEIHGLRLWISGKENYDISLIFH
jgi:hypothetical protein